jgi:hypothetical protein
MRLDQTRHAAMPARPEGGPLSLPVSIVLPVRRSILAVAGLVLAMALLGVSQAQAAQTFVPAFSFSGAGSDPGLVVSPARVAVEGSSGNVFVADSGNGRVQVFDSSGGFLTEFGADVLDAPYGVAVRDVLGETVVYVSDPATSRVVRFESDELLVPSFTVDGSFVSPAAGAGSAKVGDFAASLAVDASSGDLLVGDPSDDRVQRYDAAGGFAGAVDGSDSPAGVFTGLLDVAVDSTGDLLVVDSNGPITGMPDGSGASGDSRVERFAANGTHEQTLGGLSRPARVAVNPSSDEVVVSANQDAVDGNESPSLNVFDPSGALLHSVRMGPAAQYTTVHGLAVDGSVPRIYSVNDVGYYDGSPYGSIAVHAFELATLPDATIDPPTNIAETTADLSGTVNPNANTTTARFEVSTDGGGSWSDASGDLAVCEVSAPGDCTTPVAISHTATALTHNTDYQVRLKALIAGGAASAVSPTTESFTTDAIPPPAVVVNTPTNITDNSADISGTVDPHGFQTNYRFEYSTDSGNNWTQLDPDQDGDEDAGNGTDPIDVNETLTDLEPNTTYQIRIVATNPGGETTQGGQSLTTDGSAPTVATGVVGNLTDTTARLTAHVDANNTPTTYRFEYATGPDFSNAVALPADGSGEVEAGDGPDLVYQDVAGLPPGTTYYWRVYVQSSEGTDSAQADRPFTTYEPLIDPAACPNAEIRQRQGIAHIGNCRAYEHVSTRSINHQNVNSAVLSPDGDRVYYQLLAGAEGTSGGDLAAMVSDRTAAGWKTSNPFPSKAALGGPAAIAPAEGSLDLKTFSIAATDGFGRAKPGRLWRYDTSTRELTAGAQIPRGITQIAGYASADHRHFMASDKLSGVSGGQLYDWAGTTPELVGLMPDNQPPACGFYENLGYTFRDHVVSDDGNRAFFMSQGHDCGGPLNLYVREGGVDGTTTLISGPSSTGPDRGAQFLRATPEGSEAIFITATRLDPGDGNDTADIYRYAIGLGNECLTCVVPEANAQGMHDGAGAVAVAETGDRVYFTSGEVLAAGARPDVANLYLWRRNEPGGIEFIAPAAALQVRPGVAVAANASVSGDGSVLVFTAARAALDALSGRLGGGLPQMYRYDDRDGSLVCVSCPAQGSARHASYWVGFSQVGSGSFRYTAVSENGRSFIFKTSETLAAGDVNGSNDVYEWRDGHVDLVSDGKANRIAHATALSADGESMVLLSQSELVPGVGHLTGEDGLYVARIGGGFAADAPPPPACSSDSCQGPVSVPDRRGLAGSGSYRGAGDVRAGRPKQARCASARRSVRRARLVLRRAETRRVRVRAKHRVKRARKRLAECSRRGSRS